jgi:hypothetical protein
MPDRYLADLAGTLRNQFRITPAATSGPPVSGTHQEGELHMDSLGSVWSCVASGTPGTWVLLDPVIGGQSPSLPVSTTVLDSFLIADYVTVKWALDLRKGTKAQIFEIVGTHDGTNPTDQRPTSFRIGTGAIDIDADVDITGGTTMRLTVTPVTTGWTATWRRMFALEA